MVSAQAGDVALLTAIPIHDLVAHDDECQCTAATAWRILANSPHILDLLAEWAEWHQRRGQRDVSHAISGPDGYWTLRAGAPSYAELRRRRELTSTLPCSDCGTPVVLVHPFLDENWTAPPVLCGRCTTEITEGINT